MNIVRAVTEWLSWTTFALIRMAFLALTVSVGLAALSASRMRDTLGPWAVPLPGLMGAMAAVFGLGTLLLFLAPHLTPRSAVGGVRGGAGDPNPATAPPIGATSETESPGWLQGALGAMTLATALLSRDLLALWREILNALRQIGAFSPELARDSMSGLVLAPVLAVVSVPALQAAAALALGWVPLLVAIALATRSRHGTAFLLMMATAGTALVGGSLIAAHVFAHATDALVPLLLAERSSETQWIAGRLAHARDVLLATPLGFLLPLAIGIMAAVTGWRRAARTAMPAVVGDGGGPV